MGRRRSGWAWRFGGISLATHALLLLAMVATTASLPRAQVSPPRLAEHTTRVAAFVRHHASREASITPQPRDADRRALIARARTELSEGRLALGDFLLAAEEIDAAERGERYDLKRARKDYDVRLARLRQALESSPLHAAVAAVLSDLRYFGEPGGTVAELLERQGGSCEPLSHLTVALVYDVGLRERARLRFYGGTDPNGGPSAVTHLAPVDEYAGKTYDLILGGPSRPGGVSFSAERLVDIYEQAHQRQDSDESPHRRTLASAYPPNQDVFPGGMPMFSAHAVRDPTGEEDLRATALSESPRDCPLFIPMARLNPPRVDALGARSMSLELARMPTAIDLTRTSVLIDAVERWRIAPASDAADRLIAAACLAHLNEQAATDFALSDNPSLSKLAAERAHAARVQGQRLLVAGTDETEATTAVAAQRYPGRVWVLLILPGGAEAVIEQVSKELDRRPEPNWGTVNVLAGLFIRDETRARALPLLERLTVSDQVDVMHEVFHAHDHLRPWSVSFAPPAPTSDDETAIEAGCFSRGYRLFSALAYELWELRTAPDLALPRFMKAAAELGLDAPWQAWLSNYYRWNHLNMQKSVGLSDGDAFRRSVPIEYHNVRGCQAPRTATAP